MMLGALGTRDIGKKMLKNDEPRYEMQLTQDLIFLKILPERQAAARFFF